MDDRLNISLEGEAHYTQAGERLTQELRGQELILAGNRFRIRSLELMGIGAGRLALAVDFDGALRGRIYLVGTPELDEERAEIHVPDLDFDMATRHVLVRGAAWIAHRNLVGFLRERARLPVEEVLALAEEQFHRGINRELSAEVLVEGEVLSTRLVGVRATRESLRVTAEAEARGVVRVNLDGFPSAGTP